MAQVEMCSESLWESFIDLFGFRQIHLGCQPRFPSTVLAFTHDTVGADLALTDSGEKTYETYCKTNSEELWTHNSEVRLEDNEPKEESYESVETLCCRKSGENHVSG